MCLDLKTEERNLSTRSSPTVLLFLGVLFASVLYSLLLIWTPGGLGDCAWAISSHVYRNATEPGSVVHSPSSGSGDHFLLPDSSPYCFHSLLVNLLVVGFHTCFSDGPIILQFYTKVKCSDTCSF